MSDQTIDPKGYLDKVDARWNSGDLDGVMAYFTPEAVVRLTPPLPGGPEIYTGKEAIRSLIRAILPGFHVDSYNHRLQGERLTWTATASADAFRRLGLESVAANGEAILALDSGDSQAVPQMRAFAIVFTPETVARMQAALQSAG